MKLEHYCKEILQNLNIIVLLIAKDGIILDVNPLGCTFLGYNGEELIGQNMSVLLPFKEKDSTMEILTVEKHHNINENIKKDGSFVFIEWNNIYFNDKILSIGVDRTQDRIIKTKLSNQLLKNTKILQKTIDSLSKTAKYRDDYTAMHQESVSMIARAIAIELNLDDGMVDAIEMAGKLHDIGKIYVPISILAKPTKLTQHEMNIVKEHSQVGYEILKEIPFEYPIAEMVYQHHENLNGSGYPKGIKGDDILFGSQILTVADNIDAISSHRPYRPALGLTIALDFIVEKKEILFNPIIVDAAIEIFKKGFKINDKILCK